MGVHRRTIALAIARVLDERRLDLGRLEADAVDLHLIVEATPVHGDPGSHDPDTVARAIPGAAFAPTERAGNVGQFDESFRGQLGSVDVSGGHPDPADVQLTP